MSNASFRYVAAPPKEKALSSKHFTSWVAAKHSPQIDSKNK